MLNVISIGGNALEGQKGINGLFEAICLLSERGGLLITHGNGPQVGELAGIEHKNLGVITAQTEAEIGLALQRGILAHLARRGIKRRVEVVLTEVLVDRHDRAFLSPSKPIGRFYSKPQAQRLASRGLKMKRLIGGYRRVVASPRPKKILNLDSIRGLLDKGYIVIAGGGGGIPVFGKGKGYSFAEAVVDKDFTSSLLAGSLSAGRLFILTKERGVYLNYGSATQQMIGQISARRLSALLRSHDFEEGSIRPKVEACLEFVRKNRGIAVIGGIDRAEQTINLRGCTVIEP